MIKNTINAKSKILLLRASLLNDRRGAESWEEWKSGVILDDLDSASHEALPQLYANLLSNGISPDRMESYQKTYRFYWYRTQHIVKTANSLLEIFQQQDIEYRLLGRIPVAYKYYKMPAHKPVNQIKITIADADIGRTKKILEQEKFKPMENHPMETLFQLGGGHFHRSESGIILGCSSNILHRNRGLRCGISSQTIDDDLIINQTNHKTLPASGLFLSGCLNGVQWQGAGPLNWAMDAGIMLRDYGDKLDWDWMVDIAQSQKLSLQFRNQVILLSEMLDIQLPYRAKQRLAEISNCASEKIETSMLTSSIRLNVNLGDGIFLVMRKNPENSVLKKLFMFSGLVLNQIVLIVSRSMHRLKIIKTP